MNLKHVMLDIETLATGRDAAVASIGAVAFDPHQDRVGSVNSKNVGRRDEPIGKIQTAVGPLIIGEFFVREGSAFYARVDLKASRRPGVIDPATVEWWLGQSHEARAELLGGEREELGSALQRFAAWASKYDRLWSNGPTFDEVILRDAFARYELKFPFHYRDSRCMRTLCRLAGELNLVPEKENRPERAGVKHSALDDAVHQAVVVCQVVQGLRCQNYHADIGKRS